MNVVPVDDPPSSFKCSVTNSNTNTSSFSPVFVCLMCVCVSPLLRTALQP